MRLPVRGRVHDGLEKTLEKKKEKTKKKEKKKKRPSDGLLLKTLYICLLMCYYATKR